MTSNQTWETLLSRRQAHEKTGVPMRTLDHWLANGRLTKYVDGRRRVGIDPDELDRVLTPKAPEAAVR